MRARAWLFLVVLVVYSTIAYAQAQPGDVGVFFTANPESGADAQRLGVVPFVPFDVFVVSFDIPEGADACEFTLAMPTGLIVGPGELPPGAQDFGVGDGNWIIGFGGACRGSTGRFVPLAMPNVLFLAPPGSDVPICLEGSTPSSSINGRPAYIACTSGAVRDFGSAYAGCAVINPTASEPPMRADAWSIGTLKATF